MFRFIYWLSRKWHEYRENRKPGISTARFNYDKDGDKP